MATSTSLPALAQMEPFGASSLKRKRPDLSSALSDRAYEQVLGERPLLEITGNVAATAPKRFKFGAFVEEDDGDNAFESPAAEAACKNEAYSHAPLPLKAMSTAVSASVHTTLESARRRRRPILCESSTGKKVALRYRNPAREEAELPRANLGKAKKSFYGIAIHELEHAAENETALEREKESVRLEAELSVQPTTTKAQSGKRTLLWSEKYRARHFTDLVGDERTHRSVLKWVKAWDPIVFPHQGRAPQPKLDENGNVKVHRKILLITGPPGLGKTTLAHVAARQAGYDPLEINASDERTKDIVHGKIRDCVGTETIKGMGTISLGGTGRRSGRPVCVIVDEVDGVVGGSGDGGFVKALIDLVLLDKRNAERCGTSSKRKGDKFRLLRPMILICNDVYHPTLKPLRQSSLAEIVHIRKPPFALVVQRMRHIFEKEGFQYEPDAVRRLCEGAWGISKKRETVSRNDGPGEGDIRGVMVVAEWAATKLKSTPGATPSLTRKWVDEHVLGELSEAGSSFRGVGRGGMRDIMERVFVEGAGFAASAPSKDASSTKGLGVAEAGRQKAMMMLSQMVSSCGDQDKLVEDCFASYANYPYQDDMVMSKPNSAYNWLAFHDTMSLKVHTAQEWELAPYLNQAILGFHTLFACPLRHNYASKAFGEGADEPTPFSGPRAGFEAFEALKQNKATLQAFQAALSAEMTAAFRSPEAVAVHLVPFAARMLNPAVNPIQIGGGGGQAAVATVRKESEKRMVERAAAAMHALGVTFEQGRVEAEDVRNAGLVYRMQPPLDTLNVYSTMAQSAQQTRYAVRQIMEQEYQKRLLKDRTDARQSRFVAGLPHGISLAVPEIVKAGIKKLLNTDFFGRVVEVDQSALTVVKSANTQGDVWCSFHEGFSNAVRKPITIAELVASFEA